MRSMLIIPFRNSRETTSIRQLHTNRNFYADFSSLQFSELRVQLGQISHSPPRAKSPKTDGRSCEGRRRRKRRVSRKRRFSIFHSSFLIFLLDECLVRVVSWIVLLSWLALVASDVTTIHGAHRGKTSFFSHSSYRVGYDDMVPQQT